MLATARRIILRSFCSKAEKDIVEMSPLQKTLFKRLTKCHKDYEVAAEILAKGDQSDQAAVARRNIDHLSQKNNQYCVWAEWKDEVSELASLVSDPSMKDLVGEESENLKSRLEEMTEEALSILIEKDKYDDCNITNLEFRPGVGGAESMIFAEEMYHAIRSYCEGQGWR